MHERQHSVEKREIFCHKEIFREITSLVALLDSKTVDFLVRSVLILQKIYHLRHLYDCFK